MGGCLLGGLPPLQTSPSIPFVERPAGQPPPVRLPSSACPRLPALLISYKQDGKETLEKIMGYKLAPLGESFKKLEGL